MRVYEPKSEERSKKIWLYCSDCGFQRTNVFFYPLICPKCKNKLRILQLTKSEYDKHYEEIKDIGCKEFAQRYMRGGKIVYGRNKL